MSLLTAEEHFLFIHMFYAFDLQFTYISWLFPRLVDPGVGVGGWGASGPKQEPPGDGDLVPAPRH